MRITPLDVRKQEFKRGMRGYDCDEVRAFMTTLADEYEAVLVDNKQLRERLLEQDEKLAEYRNIEQTLRDTLMTAERVTQEARETARREGEVLVQEARQKVEHILAEGRQKLAEIRQEALTVHREKEAYLARFRSLAEAQIQFTEQHRSDFAGFDGRLLGQADGAAPAPAQTPAPAAAPAAGGDEWRDYAIAEGEQEAADAQRAEVEHIADVLQEADTEAVARNQSEAPAPDQPAPAPAPEDVHHG
jgi:cell division initiation protein